jgi:phenylacetate-CoA ligase
MSDRLTAWAKRTGVVDKVLRYNPLYYRPVRRLLRQLDVMDRAARQGLSDRLTLRALGWAARTPAGRNGAAQLGAWPILEKARVRDRTEDYYSHGSIVIPASTSGTTGTPLELRRSLRCLASEQAFIDDLLVPWNLTFRTARIARMRADPIKPIEDREPPYGVLTNGGRRLLLSASHLSPQTCDWYYDELRRFAPDVLYIHPSSGEPLARFFQQRGRSLSIPLVLTSSETVFPAGRRLMEDVFRATMIDYYGLAERVAFAASREEGAYYFNPAYGRIELLPLGDVEATPDCRTMEIVATGFWNEAMPLIRYRTGDRVIVPDAYSPSDLEDVVLGLKPVIAIQGRDKEYMISPSGEVVGGLPHVTHGVSGLVRMQFIQEALDDVRIRVVADPRVGAVDTTTLMNNVRYWVPQDMRVTIETVDELVRLPSGKTPFVIRRVE